MENDPLNNESGGQENTTEAIAAEQAALPPSEKAWHPISAHPVFVVEDTFYRSRTPNLTHWSVAWSDLMMTMFVLFLTLFVYQLAHREFLKKDEVEVVAGQTIALPPKSMDTTVPFHPISPQVSERTADQLKKIERLSLDDEQATIALNNPTLPTHEETIREETPPQASQAQPEPAAPAPAQSPAPASPAEADKPEASALEEPSTREEVITKIYDMSKITLKEEQLERFAEIELIPDKTMRIILTGDLLFPVRQGRSHPQSDQLAP